MLQPIGCSTQRESKFVLHFSLTAQTGLDSLAFIYLVYGSLQRISTPLISRLTCVAIALDDSDPFQIGQCSGRCRSNTARSECCELNLILQTSHCKSGGALMFLFAWALYNPSCGSFRALSGIGRATTLENEAPHREHRWRLKFKGSVLVTIVRTYDSTNLVKRPASLLFIFCLLQQSLPGNHLAISKSEYEAYLVLASLPHRNKPPRR